METPLELIAQKQGEHFDDVRAMLTLLQRSPPQVGALLEEPRVRQEFRRKLEDLAAQGVWSRVLEQCS